MDPNVKKLQTLTRLGAPVGELIGPLSIPNNMIEAHARVAQQVFDLANAEREMAVDVFVHRCFAL